MDGHRPPVICSTVSVFSLPLHRAFRLMAEAGFEGIEVMVTKDPDTRDAERIRDLSDDHDLPVLAVHAPFLLVSRGVWGADPIGKIDRSIDLAREVGAGIVVVHPPYRWQHAYRRWLGERLPSLAADTGVRVAVENMFPIRVRGRRVATVHAREAVEDLGTYPNVTLDTSHAAVAGLDPVELARRLGPRLTHVHLSNNAGKGWDSHLPVDDGVLPLDRLLDTLRSSGYAGAISLEIDLRARAEDWEGLRAELDRNRRLCEARLSVSA